MRAERCMLLCRWVVMLVVCYASLSWQNAHAQTQDGTAFQIQQMRQWGDNAGLFQTLSAKTLGQWNVKLGVLFNYGKDPLLLRRSSADGIIKSANVMEHQLGAEITAGIGLFDWMDFELALPVTLYQMGTVPTNGIDASISGRQLDGSAMGDLRLALKFQALTEKKHNFGLGVQIHLGVPTGSADRFGGEESVSFGIRLLAHKTFAERVRLAFNFGYQYLPSTKFVNLEISHELTYGLGLSVDVWSNRIHLLAEVAGAAGLVGGASEYNSPLELLAGARFFPILPTMLERNGQMVESGHQLAIQVGAGVGLLPGYGTPQFRIFVGINWARRGAGVSSDNAAVIVQKETKFVNQPVTITIANVKTVNIPILVEPISVDLPDVVFAFDQVEFFNGNYEGKEYTPAKATRGVELAATFLKKEMDKNPLRTLCVAGHAGVKGIATRKQYLSDQRAIKVKTMLAGYGVEGSKIVTRGYSDKFTVSGGQTEQTMDRRVRMILLPPGQISCPDDYGTLQKYIDLAKSTGRRIIIDADKKE